MKVKIRMASALICLALCSCLRGPDPKESAEGIWEPVKVEAGAGERPTLRYQLDGDGLQMSSSSGQRYAATLGGDATTLEGAPPGTTVFVREAPVFAFREIVIRDGRPVAVRIVTIVDRQVATILENRLDGSPILHAAIKR